MNGWYSSLLYKKKNLNPILKKHCGRKEFTMVYAEESKDTSAEKPPSIMKRP
jgi:hypothetical protein